MTVATYAREFPEPEYAIDQSILLRLSLMGFTDQSWHNDAVPSFQNDKARMRIWIGPLEDSDKVTYSLSRVEADGAHVDDEYCDDTTFDTFDEAVEHMLAFCFSEELREALTPPEFDAVRWLNALKYKDDPQVCGSHDYCDPNMNMAAVFESFGFPIPDDSNGLFDLWGTAWDIAKTEHLTAELPNRPSET